VDTSKLAPVEKFRSTRKEEVKTVWSSVDGGPQNVGRKPYYLDQYCLKQHANALGFMFDHFCSTKFHSYLHNSSEHPRPLPRISCSCTFVQESHTPWLSKYHGPLLTAARESLQSSCVATLFRQNNMRESLWFWGFLRVVPRNSNTRNRSPTYHLAVFPVIEPGVAGGSIMENSSPSTLTTSLAIPIPWSSFPNTPTTTLFKLMTRSFCPGVCVVWVSPKFVRSH